ncbi:ABC transporter substrate-binding protein [Glycomyces harbinensis]|uniref:Multiple sugar transport system substrate-binding protein n=1 Tax=Glycomyces harbinensis TaxID=58114 RepID=A0A1G7C7T6_9ACTN|nr:ABC transporter substrate-binding protein [Glycomyces harbinensis]SDE35379.1 multiple sugar transport system substrate-binding protein [Glycomyces harbinensis]
MKTHLPRRAPRWRSVAALALGGVLLAGCTSPPSDGGGIEGETLTVWFPGTNQAEIDLVTGPIAEAFEEETGAKLDVTFVDWGDLSTKLNAAFAAGTAPDVFGHGPAAIADFVVNERLEPLDDYLAELEPADVEDMAAALPGGQVDGAQYLMPLSMQGSLIVYDAADFTDAGLDPDAPPTTWEEVRAVAEDLTVRDGDTITRSGLLMPSQAIGRQQTFAALLGSAGGSQLNEEGTEAAFDSEQGVQALEFFTELFAGPDAVSADLGADYINAPAAQQPIVLDTAAMMIQSASGANQIIAAAPELDLRVMDALPFEGQDAGSALGGSGPGLMINADSELKNLAWAFISHLLEPEVSAEYTEGIGAVPVRASAAETAYVQDSPALQVFMANASDFEPNPNVPGWVQARDTLDKYLEQALNGVLSAQEALDQAAQEVDMVLESSR